MNPMFSKQQTLSTQDQPTRYGKSDRDPVGPWHKKTCLRGDLNQSTQLQRLARIWKKNVACGAIVLNIGTDQTG